MSKIFNNAKKVQNISGNPNLIINGNFNIWQRGPLHTSTGYNADRWVGVVLGSVSFSKINAVNLRNSSFALRAATTKNNSSFLLKQIIETNNVVFVRGKTVILSFYAKIPESYKGQNNNWNTTLQASVIVSDEAIDNIIGATELESSIVQCSLSSSWSRFDVVFDVPDTAQTIAVQFKPLSNDLLDNSVCDITQVKLELGTVPTNYDDSLYIDELRKCQRYYQKIEVDLESGAQNGQPFGTTIPLVTEMRTTNPFIGFDSQNYKGINNLSTLLSSNKQSLKIKGNATSNSVSINTSLTIDGEIGFGSVPNQVSNAQSIRDTNNDTMTITWTEPNDNGLAITSYIVKYGDNPLHLTNSLTTPTNSGVISGVLDYVTYYYTIQAENSFGLSPLSSIYISGPDTEPPLAPSNVTASWGANNHYISWSAPSGDGGSPVLHYNIQRSTTPDFTQNPISFSTDISVSPTTNITLTNSPNSNNYYFRVAAINALGTGNYSDIIFLQRTAPSAPISLSTTAINSGVILSWSNPVNNGGSPISGYIINHSSTSGFTTASVANVGLTSSTTIAGLPNSLIRYFRIAAVNSIGSSLWSSSVFATPNQPPTTAQPPQNLTASWSDPTLINVSFQEPRTDGGSPVLNYNIQLSTNSGFTQDIINFNTTSSASNRIYSIPVSAVSTTPGFYVRALSVNAVGSGAYGTSILLNKGLPPAPVNLSATPGNASVYLKWQASSISSGISVTGFAIDRSTSTTFNTALSSVNIPISLDEQQYYSTNLVNNTSYYFRIRSITPSGTSPYSNIVTAIPKAPSTSPSVPVIVVLDRPSATGLRLYFRGSLNNGGSPITSYTLGYTTGLLSTTSGTTAATHFNLSQSNYVTLSSSQTNQYISLPIAYNSGIVAAIRANNTIGSSDWTKLIFRDLYLAAPASVTNMTYAESISHIGSGIGTITWSDPTNWGGETNDLYKTYNVRVHNYDRYLGYRLLYNLTSIEYSNTNQNTITINGLVPGTRHYVSISAKNRTYSSAAKTLYFTPTNLVKPKTGGWTLSVPTPITDSSVHRSQSWDYFRGYSNATYMDNDNRQNQNNIWVSLEMYKTAVTRFYGSYLRYSNARKPSDDGLWIKATFPAPGVYVSTVHYATPLPGIYIPTDFTGYNNSKTILTETLAVNSLNGALLQYSTDDTNWITATSLSVPNTRSIYSYKLGDYPVYCRYIRIYIPYTTANFGKRLAVGILNFE
jgi:hypothetical protein